jgi:hypothetical protein
MRAVVSVILLYLISGAGLPVEERPIYLGFVEEHPEGRVEIGLRVAFRKDHSGWTSLCPTARDYTDKSECEVNYETVPKKWRLADSTQSFRIERSDSNYYSDAGLYPVREFSMPGTPTPDFAGWDGGPVRPPIPALSRVSANSPGIAGTLVPLDVKAVIRRFRSDVGRVETCSSSGDPGPLNYSDRDLLIRKHNFIPDRFVSVEIDPELNTCDGPPDANWSTYWYRVNAKGEIKRVNFDLRHPCSEYSCTVRLINSLNADEDGKPEVLFWLSSYNEGGYALLPGNSDTPISFTWTYH